MQLAKVLLMKKVAILILLNLFFVYEVHAYRYEVVSCEEIKSSDVTIARASNIDEECINLYMAFPSEIEKNTPVAPVMIGNYSENHKFSVKLQSVVWDDSKKEVTSHFCLSEEAIKKTKIVIDYMDFYHVTAVTCQKRIIIDNIEELISISDEESKSSDNLQYGK